MLIEKVVKVMNMIDEVEEVTRIIAVKEGTVKEIIGQIEEGVKRSISTREIRAEIEIEVKKSLEDIRMKGKNQGEIIHARAEPVVIF